MISPPKKTTFLIRSLGILVLLFTFSCAKEVKNEGSQVIAKKEYAPEKNEVQVITLKKEAFKEEIISNGRLRATKKSILKFKVTGDLVKLNVREGTFVKKGSTLAQLDGYTYKEALQDAKIALKRSELEFQDILINRGYDLNKKEEIPDKIFEIAELRSGFAEAKQKLKKAEHDLHSISLVAPFSGKVAAIQYKLFEEVGLGTTFLTLINDSSFEVEFYVTESEVNKIKVNQAVNASISNLQKTYKGRISAINPMVEKNGTVKIKARIQNDGRLIEGMNVNIRIEQEVQNQFIVPKSAVILRQDQEVLFKVVNGKSFWTYVKTINENKDQYSVMPNPEKKSATLEEGEIIIVSGNLNLAHDTEVDIINKKTSGIKN